MLVVALMSSLHREVYYCSTHLDSLVIAWEQGCPLLDQNEGAEFGLVILKHKLTVFKLNFGVAA